MAHKSSNWPSDNKYYTSSLEVTFTTPSVTNVFRPSRSRLCGTSYSRKPCPRNPSRQIPHSCKSPSCLYHILGKTVSSCPEIIFQSNVGRWHPPASTYPGMKQGVASGGLSYCLSSRLSNASSSPGAPSSVIISPTPSR